jgi:hypothetical protein
MFGVKKLNIQMFEGYNGYPSTVGSRWLLDQESKNIHFHCEWDEKTTSHAPCYVMGVETQSDTAIYAFSSSLQPMITRHLYQFVYINLLYDILKELTI